MNNIQRMNENDLNKNKKTSDGKSILRKVLRKHVPENVSKAPKQGFSAPDESWFKGESIEFVKKQY